MKIKTKISIGLLVFFAIILVSMVLFWFQLNRIQAPITGQIFPSLTQLTKKTALDILANDIKYYDEVLTQAARNFAFTKDKKWEQAYRQAELELDSVIKEFLNKDTEREEFFLIVSALPMPFWWKWNTKQLSW
ncbi:MAG: hypothetical protein HY979_02075 [Candidatus Magasanikbacteria bacterium]|nr:hypothetical protein [Candidatus Magasanikbacteria bacterium]